MRSKTRATFAAPGGGRQKTMRYWLDRAIILLLAATALAGQTGHEWPAGASEYRIHVVGQGHLDAVWLWPWYESVAEAHSTFRSILDRMEEDPKFTFTAASSQFYVWIEENDPAMLREIRRRVEEGRWGLAGGWWVEADASSSGGESLVRQGLYGQRTLQRLFGRTTDTGYNPDAPGHPASLPQILKLQGLDYFLFTRPRPNEMKLPAGLFRWVGIDGTSVVAYRPPQDSFVVRGSIEQAIRRVISETQPTTKDLLLLIGAGDHGGGPTKQNMREVREIQSQPGAPTVQYNIPETYFAKTAKSGIPEVRGGLLHHAVGGYTNVSEMKKDSRTAEGALLTAEKLAAVGSAAWEVNYPKAALTQAWERSLYQHVHDSINGVSLPSHYETTGRDAFGYALDTARRTMYMAAQKLAWDVPAEDPDSQYLFVFNPHAWEVTANARYQFNLDADTAVRVEDERGNLLPHQWTSGTVRTSRNWRVLNTRVKLPPFGYRQIRIRPETAPARLDTAVRATNNSLENEHLRVTFAETGAIGILDKNTGREVFAGGATGARAVILDDPHDSWANIEAFDNETGAFGNATTRIVENGPLLATIRVRATYGSSRLTTDWTLHAGTRTLEARVVLDWHEQQKMLKLSFPVDAAEPRANWEIPYGHVSRPSNGDEQPGHRWIDVTGRRGEGEYGLAVVNDAKYGYSVNGNDMRVSIVRSPLYGHRSSQRIDPETDYDWQNQGRQSFRMLLIPHTGSWQDAGVARAAEELTAPLPIILQGIHPGSRPQADSFLSIDAANIIVSAVKQSESGADLVFRCRETAGRPATVTLDVRFAKRKWSGTFRPNEIKTLRFDMGTGVIREVNVLEE